MTTIYDFSVRNPDGEDVPMTRFRNTALLVVNTASRCQFTPQYAGLEQLQQRFGEKGFSVLGFPCNQFGAQEPGTAAEIADFCLNNYVISFPIFAKTDVNGSNAAPLFTYLKHAKRGLFGLSGIKWNFTKFLIDRTGVPVRRFAPATRPDAIGKAIEKLI